MNDMLDQTLAELARLRAENAKLREACERCLGALLRAQDDGMTAWRLVVSELEAALAQEPKP